MPNPFVHVELHTADIDKAKKFYSQLFAWQLEDVPMPGGTYTVIKPGKGTGGGMMQQRVPGAPSSWLAYVEVDDITAATQKAKSLGAKITMDVMELPGIGWMSMLIDPTGAVLALWKPASA
jgi:predicted enzyme related to lactoylglutathione lyase